MHPLYIRTLQGMLNCILSADTWSYLHSICIHRHCFSSTIFYIRNNKHIRGRLFYCLLSPPTYMYLYRKFRLKALKSAILHSYRNERLSICHLFRYSTQFLLLYSPPWRLQNCILFLNFDRCIVLFLQ